MSTGPVQTHVSASSIQWRDTLIQRLALTAMPAAYLTDIGDGGAALFLADSSLPLILLLWPTDEKDPSGSMRERIKRVLAASPGPAHVVVIGGDDDARRLCRTEQPGWRFSRRSGLHQLSESGVLWNAGGKLRLLDATVANVRTALGRGEPLPPLAQQEAVAARDAFRSLATVEKGVALSLRKRGRPATIGLLATLIAFYILETLWGGAEAPGVLYRMGAVDRASFLRGEWWRLISPAFLHASPLHIAVNGWSLWVLGVLMERLFGTARFLVLYVAGGIVAAIASTMFAPGMSVGASGAIFALMGGLFALAWRPSGLLPPTMIRRLRRSLWPPLLANVAISMAPSVDWYAHLGGAVCGVVLVGTGLLLRGLPQPGDREGSVAASPGWVAAAGLAVVIVIAGLAAALARGQPWAHGLGAMTRVTLAPTRLSIQIPASLPLTAQDDQTGRTERLYGQLSKTEADIYVIATASGGTIQAEELRQQAGAIDDHGFKHSAEPTVQTTPDGVVAQTTGTDDQGAREDIWLVARPEGLVRIDVRTVAGSPSGWQEIGPSIVESLRTSAH